MDRLDGLTHALGSSVTARVSSCYSFVRLYEEPILARTYGAEYEEYRRAVRGWVPSVRR
jgi:protein-S-isoprenylcysteine O-methyltransferase Ste14